MKVLFCYYSGMGNTKLACDYIVRKIPSVTFTFHDIVADTPFNLNDFDAVGFATFADFLSPPRLFSRFIKELPQQDNKPAFIFNTYGNFNAGTLAHIYRRVARQGFSIIAADALFMPESIPVMICMGIANTQAPEPHHIAAFDRFIEKLAVALGSADSGNAESYTLPLAERLWPPFPRWLGRWQMGPKFVDTEKCTRCGLCMRECPYKAIAMNDAPQFDEKKCFACWRCYNRCPPRAIYTKKYRERGHYPKPPQAVVEKLGK